MIESLDYAKVYQVTAWNCSGLTGTVFSSRQATGGVVRGQPRDPLAQLGIGVDTAAPSRPRTVTGTCNVPDPSEKSHHRNGGTPQNNTTRTQDDARAHTHPHHTPRTRTTPTLPTRHPHTTTAHHPRTSAHHHRTPPHVTTHHPTHTTHHMHTHTVSYSLLGLSLFGKSGFSICGEPQGRVWVVGDNRF